MIHINRFVDYGKPDEGTFGTLTFDGFFCYTVEKPWVNNLRYLSCIPAGDYYAEHYNSPKFGSSVIIHGGTVSKFPDSNFQRHGILIHPANWSSNVTGCIGLGEIITVMDNRAAVSNSRKTVAEFLKRINIGEVYNLRITYSETF